MAETTKDTLDENTEQTPESDDDTIENNEEAQTETAGVANFLSPEALVMFLIAGIFDLIGLLFFILSFIGIGIILSWIFDFIALFIIGGWMFFRSGKITTTKKTKKVLKKILKRLGLSFLGEIIPFFGDLAPCWTLGVYFTLKND